jgi:uncharacterized protein DUF5678
LEAELKTHIDARTLAGMLGRPLREIQEDFYFVSSNLENLTKLYQDEWIAVIGQEVVAHSPELDDLNNQLTTLGKDVVGQYVQFLVGEQQVLTL